MVTNAAEQYVGQHALASDQLVLLKDHAGAFSMFMYTPGMVQLSDAINRDVAGAGTFEQIQAPQQRGFACTRSAEQYRELPRYERQCCRMQRCEVSVLHRNFVKLDQGLSDQ